MDHAASEDVLAQPLAEALADRQRRQVGARARDGRQDAGVGDVEPPLQPVPEWWRPVGFADPPERAWASRSKRRALGRRRFAARAPTLRGGGAEKYGRHASCDSRARRNEHEHEHEYEHEDVHEARARLIECTFNLLKQA